MIKIGLDMYLERKHYVRNWDWAEKTWDVQVRLNGNLIPESQIDPAKISYVIEQVAYWRKANEIHHWFVQNVQDGIDDCKRYYVSTDKLSQLLGTVREVLADHEKHPGST